MSTTIANILIEVRDAIHEPVARFWSDSELISIMQHGVHDLWGAVLDAHGEHFLTVDTTNVSLVASGTTISGLPTGCFRVQLIEPAITSQSGTAPDLMFVPKRYNSPEFAYARSLSPQDPRSCGVVYYAVAGVGAPIGSPTIYVAPALTSTLALRFAYNPTISIDATGSNPLPGEADHALKAWTIAYARAKETDDQMPDASWLSIYSTEKQSILTRIVPRQEQELEYVRGMFEG